MKVCLATVHASQLFPPLALQYLKAYLVAQGTLAQEAVRILEFSADATAEDIARRVLADEPDVIGFSCYVWNIISVLAASRRVREMKPDIRIVLGGPEVGPVGRAVLEDNPAVDCVVISEGELVFNALVSAWQHGGDIANVQGIFYRRADVVFESAAAPVLRDLNHLPSPSPMYEGDPKGRVICVETQRGCVFRCSFCFYNKDLSIRNRRYDMARVKQELGYWLEQDISQLYLMDPIFNLNAARAKEICRFIAAHNRRRIPIHTEIWAEFVDEEMARLMHEAHFRFLEVGLQTTDAAALLAVERRLKLGPFIEGIGHLRRFDLPFELQLIYGLPGETRASFRSALNFAASLQPPDLVVFPLLLLPGTELRRKSAALGIDFDPQPPYRVRSHPSMPPADIDYGMKLADAMDRIGRSWTIRLLSREPGLNFTDVIDAWMQWGGDDTIDGHERDSAEEQETLRRFILRFCAAKGIPDQFYAASAGVEFSARTRAGATAA